MADREGFEPSIGALVPYNGLANRRLQPLGHLSIWAGPFRKGVRPFYGPPIRLSTTRREELSPLPASFVLLILRLQKRAVREGNKGGN